MLGKYHFIAIGGSVMHALAIFLKREGHTITGSDDNIYGYAKTRLEEEGLFPASFGWFPEKVTDQLDGVIVGMHAKKDNPEILKARELGLKVYSFPDYIYSRTINKQRVVVAGSHGKTSITAMIIHVLQFHNKKFDYVIGARVDSLEDIIQLSNAPTIIIEGDEYFSSPLDPTPKFLNYHHHIGIISGIAWDHANVFPTEEGYVEEFVKFADATPKGGTLIFNKKDKRANEIGSKNREDVLPIPYTKYPHLVEDGITYLKEGNKKIPLQIFGEHNMSNISAAWNVVERLGITLDNFLEAISSFKGASRRLQKIYYSNGTTVYNDFAHAPSKVLASVHAVKNQFPSRKLVACLELHTFSSLTKHFLPQYEDTLNGCDVPVIYYNPENITKKNMEMITKEDLIKAFNNDSIHIFTDLSSLQQYLLSFSWENTNLLLMSSGNFGNMDIENFTKKIKQPS